MIGADEALVEFYYQGRALHAFVLDREQLRAINLNVDGMEDQVRALREALTRPKSDAWKTPARALYGQLWQPLEPFLGKVRNVVVVAHGALHYLPFAVLQKSDGGLLIDQVGLRMLPSASVLKYLRPMQQGAPANLLALGNPDLNDATQDLRFAEAEVRAIANMLPETQLLLRKEASKTNFRKIGMGFSRIHFAVR